MACGGMISQKNFKFSKKKHSFYFISFHLIFFKYRCSINFERQSEHSGLRPDTSSLLGLYLLRKKFRGIEFSFQNIFT